MNAHALLTAQGWRGTGHSLHPTSDSTGLTHHILIKRNQDGSGLGSKKDHRQEAWWLNAFDQALKGIDMKSGTMKQTLKGGALEKITARNAATKYTGARGLYTSFVRGGTMDGSVNDPAASLPTPPDSGAGTPLATGSEANGGKDDKREESKEERRARREAKRLRKAEKEAQREAKKRAAEKVEKKKAKKAERQAAKEKRKAGETKEERRARRDARRRRKEEKRLRRAAKG